MASVWVVEKGTYSDYRVVGVFTSKENAQRICDLINNDESWETATIAEWPLDPAINELNQGMAQWVIHMRKDGKTERVEQVDEYEYDLSGEIRVWERSKAPIYRGVPDKPDLIIAKVWATDATHAVKIVNEKRAEWIALGKWP